MQASTAKSDNPLEVYEPGLTAAKVPDLRTTIAFYRGQVKVLETPVVARFVYLSGQHHR